MSDSINKLIDIFKKFPTVGSRTAGRFVYYLMKLPKERTDDLVNAIIELKNHPFFVGTQFHPEFKSRPLKPHPLFKEFIKSAIKK